MFEDSLFASTARPSRQRGLTAIVSFCVQAVGIGLFVLVPLLYTDAVPLGSLKSYVEIPPPPGRAAPQPAQSAHTAHARTTEMVGNTVMQPRFIPTNIPVVVDRGDSGPVGDGPGVVGMPPGFGNGSPVLNSIIATTTEHIAPPSVRQSVVSLSTGVTEGLLVYKVKPTYPPLARMAHVQGTVVLQAIIGRNGRIEHLQAISGHPLLVQAALDAVEQWRYQPYLLNNQPVDVNTQITVNFTLSQ